jgi:hypothetical protein
MVAKVKVKMKFAIFLLFMCATLSGIGIGNFMYSPETVNFYTYMVVVSNATASLLSVVWVFILYRENA